mgnify:FL=1
MKNRILNSELALCILKEELAIDEIAIFEVKKKMHVSDWSALFAQFEQVGIGIDTENRLAIEYIYDIIYQEQAYSGGYRRVNAKSPARIRSLIGKWNPPTQGQMKVGDATNDIFLRACNRIQGEKYYYTGRGKEKHSKGRYAYKLIINGETVLFLDLNRLISYHIRIV